MFPSVSRAQQHSAGKSTNFVDHVITCSAADAVTTKRSLKVRVKFISSQVCSGKVVQILVLLLKHKTFMTSEQS